MANYFPQIWIYVFCLVGGRAKKPKSTQVDPERFQDRNDELWALGSKNDLRIRWRSHTLLEERMEVFFFKPLAYSTDFDFSAM